LKKDLQLLLPTRENSRRLQSDILKPWNDLENQKFEKIHDSSYYKIDHQFPLPICSAKLDPIHKGFYKGLLNDDYLSLAMGSENFKFKDRNINENLIFKNEDEMYKLDTQIEMFEKCYSIIENEIKIYDEAQQKSPRDKIRYEFPRHKLRPLMHYWEKKYKDALIHFFMQ
jgi:histone deacetylase complex regulatory component SIN3